MVLQNGIWKYNDSGRLMPPMLRLPSQSLHASASKASTKRSAVGYDV